MPLALKGYELYFENPTFSFIFEDKVYGKEMIFQNRNNPTETISLIYLLVPKVYTEASEEEVYRYLRHKAKEVAPYVNFFFPHGRKPETLEELLFQLPEAVINDFVDRKKILKSLIKINTPSCSGQYLKVRSGIIPLDTLENAWEANILNETQDYDLLLRFPSLKQQGYGERWYLRFYLDNYSLPLRSELEHFLKERTIDQSLFYLNHKKYLWEIEEMLPLFYEQLFTPQRIKHFLDVSEQVKRELAAYPAQVLFEKFGGVNAAFQKGLNNAFRKCNPQLDYQDIEKEYLN